jgi:hypothetical protein
VRDGAVHGPHVLDEVHVLLGWGSSKRLAALAHMLAVAKRVSAAVAPRNTAANGRGKRLASYQENEPVGGEPPWLNETRLQTKEIRGQLVLRVDFEREGGRE